MRTRVSFMVLGLLLAGTVLAGCGSDGDDGDSGDSADTSSAPCSPTTKQYDTYPPMSIDAKKKYAATFELAKGGTFEVALYADKAPKTVNSFVFLAREKFFDCLTFHRVIAGFMAQGGDPTGSGMGGPGYQFEDEFTDDLTFDEAGTLAMANSGPATNGSQFFITFAPTPHLNGLHTIFGKVTSGLDVVLAITERDPASAGPADQIKTVTISEK